MKREKAEATRIQREKEEFERQEKARRDEEAKELERKELERQELEHRSLRKGIQRRKHAKQLWRPNSLAPQQEAQASAWQARIFFCMGQLFQPHKTTQAFYMVCSDTNRIDVHETAFNIKSIVLDVQ